MRRLELPGLIRGPWLPSPTLHAPMVSKQARSSGFSDRDLVQEVDLLEREILPVGNEGSEGDQHPVEIVEAILRRVSNTPREAVFVAFLRRLLRVDSNSLLENSIWNVLERLLRKSALLQRTFDSLQRAPPQRPESTADRALVQGTPDTPGVMPGITTPTNPAGQGSCNFDSCCSDPTNTYSSTMLRESMSTSTLPPIPPPLPACGPPPPPPPLVGLRAPVRPDSAPPSSRGSPRGSDESSIVQLPQQRTPFPKQQMKRFQWNKIPVSRVTSRPGNLWAEVGGMFEGYQLNFERMEELFASAGSGTSSCSSVNGSSAGTKVREIPVPEGSSCERKIKKIDEINLLDSKRSMNVNIFLRQFRMSNVDIVNCLRSGESQKIGPERLRTLLKILPEPEDLQLLSAFEGDRSQLGSAEKFYIELITLPNHKFLAEALLMKEEFSQTIDSVKPAIDAIILSARDIKDSKALHEILYTVLIAGNFLNSGVYSGNAAGFQLQSLLKLSELRANKPHMNLLHFVAQETEAKNPHLIDKLKELKYLAEASQYSVESLLSDISTLQNRVRTISSQISTTDVQFQRQMKDFLEMAHGELEVLELDMRELEELRQDLAAYFCEDIQTFKLDDCISNFSTFCKMFHKALEENKERHLQDLRAEERRRLREEQLANKRRSLDESQSRRSPDSNAMTSPEVSVRSVDGVDYARPRTTNSNERRIQISQAMPSFLLETTHDSSREVSPCPGMVPGNRHKKRNSMSNFPKLENNRKTLPQTPGESTNAERENELIDVLLKTASAAEDTDRRPGSTRQRRRSRASIDILDRERAPSPSPLNASVPHMDTGSPANGTANGEHDQLDRGQPSRSSCPSRISSAQGRNQLLKDTLLHQQATHDTTADGQMEDSGGSCPSDAEVSAKQERENRRLERRRRSHLDSISCGDGKPRPSSELASDTKGQQDPTTGLDMNPTRINFTQESEHLEPSGKQAAETQSGDGELRNGHLPNLPNGSSTSSADLFYEDVNSRTTVTRRDAANIRSLGDQRPRSSDLENQDTTSQTLPTSNTTEMDQVMKNVSSTDNKCNMAKRAPEHKVNQSIDVKTIRKASVEQDRVSSAPAQKSRLNNLVKQRNIPEQRISGATKLSSASHKNIANAERLQKNETESRKLRSQSDYRLIRDSNVNLTESTHSLNQKMPTGERISGDMTSKETCKMETDGCTKHDQDHLWEAAVLSAPGVSSQPQGPSADDDYQKRWGKVFENTKKEAHTTSTSSHARQNPQTHTLENEKFRENNAGSRTKEPAPPIQSATVRDHGELLSGANAVERASFRKEKLRKLSQMYSWEDDEGSTKTQCPTNNHPPEVALQHGQGQPPIRTPSRDSAADPKSDTDSIHSARDEGFDSEGHSLCSASQRTSMSSTAESEIRITPMMSRKKYPADGENEAGDKRAEHPGDSETSTPPLGRSSIDSERIEKADDSPKHIDDVRKESPPPSRSLTKTSSKLTLSGSRDRQATDKTGVRKGLAKPIDSQRLKTQPHSAAAPSKALPKTIPAPRSAAAASTTVQYRIAKPNLVSVSRTPTPKSDNRTVKTNPDKKVPTAIRLSTTPATMNKSPSKTDTKQKLTGAIKKQSTENRVTSIAPSPSNPGTVAVKTHSADKSVHPQAFVRGVGVRATVPADVLRENKKAAIESRQVRNIATTPVPPRRTTSLLDSNNAAATHTTGAPVLHPRKQSVSSAVLPAMEAPTRHLNTTSKANEAKSSPRKASSELRMPVSKADRSKVSTRIPDHAARRLSTDPHIGEGNVRSSVSAASVGIPKRRQDNILVPSVQAKVIHVAPHSKTPNTVIEKGKSKTPAAKATSV